MNENIREPRGARLWWEWEQSCAGQGQVNPYAAYAPVEVRAWLTFLRTVGAKEPVFTESHFALWDALRVVSGQDRFTEPLGVSPREAVIHLVGDLAP